MKAWQRQIRERRALEEHAETLFGAYWESLDLSQSEVRAISERTAAKVIAQYEWLGVMPAIVIGCYGIFFDGTLGGAVVYSPDYAENLGVWDRYGYTGKIVLLSRGACVHWAPDYAGSRLIRASIKLLPRQYEIVTATVDALAGEIGTIYQAAGFDYAGVMSQGGRAAIRKPNGRLITSRQVRRELGCSSRAAVEAAGFEYVPQIRKARYFAFRGSHAAKKRNRNAIANLIAPYPKREMR